jgi:hypothetical protein
MFRLSLGIDFIAFSLRHCLDSDKCAAPPTVGSVYNRLIGSYHKYHIAGSKNMRIMRQDLCGSFDDVVDRTCHHAVLVPDSSVLNLTIRVCRIITAK